jgi:hypothetical protein
MYMLELGSGAGLPPGPAEVFCDMTGGGWAYANQVRKTPSWSRSWANFRFL